MSNKMTYRELEEALDRKVAEARGYREALEKYGKHLPNCLGGMSGRTECTCGLFAALNA